MMHYHFYFVGFYLIKCIEHFRLYVHAGYWAVSFFLVMSLTFVSGQYWCHRTGWNVFPPFNDRVCMGFILFHCSLNYWIKPVKSSGPVFFLLGFIVNYISVIDIRPLEFSVSPCISFGNLHISRNMSFSSRLSNVWA